MQAPPYAHPESLVTTEWLAEHQGYPDIRILDASWYLPTENRDAKAEYADAHIPGAVHFDIDRVADENDPLPHMFPDAAKFSAEVGTLGVRNGDHVVIYDGGNLAPAARVWWMFKAFGHRRVSVLDGGLGKWRREGRPLSDQVPALKPSGYAARLDRGMLRQLPQMLRLLSKGGEQILDARSAGRFSGKEPEPRPGLRAGHIPGSANLPYTQLLAEDGTLKDMQELERLFRDAGVDPERPVVATCGSGVSAAALLLGLHLVGAERLALYDGSWAEWGSREDTPIAP